MVEHKIEIVGHEPTAAQKKRVRKEAAALSAADPAQAFASVDQLLDRQLEVCLALRHRVG